MVDDALIAAVLEEYDEHPIAVWVGWRAPVVEGRARVVWVDGELAAWTAGEGDVGLWVLLDRGVAHRVDLHEVGLTDLLDGRVVPPVRERVTVQRDERWPVDARIVFAGEDGAVEAALWPGGFGRGGFGGRFGFGAFGVEGEGSAGLGSGQLGDGPLGLDGEGFILPGDVRRALGGVLSIGVYEGGQLLTTTLVEGLSVSDGPTLGGVEWVDSGIRVREREAVCG